MGGGNQRIQLGKVRYCKLLTSRKQLPAFPFQVRLLAYISDVFYLIKAMPIAV